ncbi:MAG: hypothetical protein II938_04575 [Alphaproteobacteria bacterium]|nr:hypothetical protein [Alphaproteobacteria bacterium]
MLKQTLLAFSILSVAGAAAAADITNPFYVVSEQGEIGFITSASARKVVEKGDFDRSKSTQYALQEEVRVGLTDSLALVGTVGNTWDRWKSNWDRQAWRRNRDNENINWSAGMAWNITTGPARWQVSGKYGQDRLKNFDGEYKYVAGETKLGYQFKRALPYVTGGIEVPVGQKSGLKGFAGDKFTYNAKAGVYQGKCEVWALDTGVRLTYDENREARVVTAEAEASYYITPKIALGVYGTYALDGRAKYGTDIYDKSVGARLRMFF